MQTEASVYEELVSELIDQVIAKMKIIDQKDTYTPQDEIDYAALDRLMDRLEALEPY